MTITLSRAQAADIPMLEPLWVQVHRHHQAVAPDLAPYVSDETTWQHRQAIYAHALQAGGALFVARSGPLLVGYTVLAPVATHWDATFVSADTLLEIVTLAVAEGYRQHGIGNQLLQAADAFARDHGYHDMLIGALPQNARAVALYRRHGFLPSWHVMTRLGQAASAHPHPMEAAAEFAPVAADEIDSLRALWLTLHRHHQASAPHLAPFVSDDVSWQVMRRLLIGDAALGQVWRCGAKEAPVGFVRFGEDDPELILDTWQSQPRIGDVHVLVVDPAMRNRGLGSALLAIAGRAMRNRGLHDHTIGLIAGNHGAQRLYARNGFRLAYTHMTRFQRRPASDILPAAN